MSDKQYDFGLLQYSGTDDNKVVANSMMEDTEPTLLQYLTRNNIPVVQEVPDRWGVFCVYDSVYKVYIVYFDKESGIYIKEYKYSLKWISIVAKSLDDDKPEVKIEL
jgi:hypothetical protein